MFDITTFIQNNPRTSMIILAFLMSLFINIVSYYMTDREKMKEIKERQKDLRKQMKLVKNNPEKVMELNKKMLEDMPEQLKLSMRPMIITLIPLLIFFGWLRSTFAETAIAGTWFWWYIGASIVASIIIRKLMGLQ